MARSSLLHPFVLPAAVLLLFVVACAPASQPAGVAAPPASTHAHAVAPATAASSPAPIEHAASAQTRGAFGSGQPVTVTLHVHDAAGAAMGPERFQTVHEQKLHVLIVDPSLGDYHHVHPEALARAGDWRFEFRPGHDRPYHLWLDATPVGGKQHYALVTINAAGTMAPVQRRLATQARVGDIAATLSFDTPPRAGEMAAARVVLTRAGRPLRALEPVMGAYAHVVGISEDWQTIAHVHPLGAGPRAPGERGGPELRFHLEPARAGYLALFVQLRVAGRDVFLPFGIEVAPGA
jgi:hypothetical protein